MGLTVIWVSYHSAWWYLGHIFVQNWWRNGWYVRRCTAYVFRFSLTLESSSVCLINILRQLFFWPLVAVEGHNVIYLNVFFRFNNINLLRFNCWQISHISRSPVLLFQIENLEFGYSNRFWFDMDARCSSKGEVEMCFIHTMWSFMRCLPFLPIDIQKIYPKCHHNEASSSDTERFWNR